MMYLSYFTEVLFSFERSENFAWSVHSRTGYSSGHNGLNREWGKTALEQGVNSMLMNTLARTHSAVDMLMDIGHRSSSPRIAPCL